MYLSFAVGFAFFNLLFGTISVFVKDKDSKILDGVVIAVDKKGSIVQIEHNDNYKDVYILSKYPVGTELKIDYNGEGSSATVWDKGDFKYAGFSLLACFAMDMFYILLGSWGDISFNAASFILLVLASFFMMVAGVMKYALNSFENSKMEEIDIIYMYSKYLEADERFESPVFRYFDNGEEKFIDNLEYYFGSELEMKRKFTHVFYDKEKHDIISEFELKAYGVAMNVCFSLSLILLTCILLT